MTPTLTDVAYLLGALETDPDVIEKLMLSNLCRIWKGAGEE